MIPAKRAHLTVAAVSDPGMSGKNNEDRYGVSAYRLNDELQTPSLLAIVADGIGGHRSGEYAAELAVEKVSKFIAESDAKDPSNILREALIQTGQIIFEMAEEDTNNKGMGTTCVCAWVIGDRLYAASVGDSRIYLLRGQKITQLTVDHTWVQEALDQGALKPEQARNHPNAHVIRRFLGSRQEVVPDLRLRLGSNESEDRAEVNQGMALMPGDILLLCSDGLTDLIEDVELLAAFKGKELEATLGELVEWANERGGHDNITVIAMKLPRQAIRSMPKRIAGLRLWPTLLIVGTLVGVAIAGAVGLNWYLNRPVKNPSPVSTSSQFATLFPTSLETQLPVLVPATANTNTRKPTSTRPAALTLTPSPQEVETTGSYLFTLTAWPTNTRSP